MNVKSLQSESILFRSGSHALAVQILGAGAIYLSYLALARWLGEAGFGSFAFSMSAAQIIASVVGIGFPFAALRFVPQYIETDNPALLKGFLKRGLTLTLTISLILAAVLSLLSAALGANRPGIAALVVGAWMVPILGLYELFRDVLRGLKRVVSALLFPRVLQPTLLIGICAAVYVYSGALSARQSLAIAAMVGVVLLSVQLTLLRRRLPDAFHGIPARYSSTKWTSVALPLLCVQFFVLTLGAADLLLLGIIVEPELVAYYAAATRTATLTSYFLIAINTIGAPLIAEMHTSGKREELQKLVRKACRLSFWSSLAMAAVLIGAGHFILSLFGKGYLVAYPILVILALGHLSNAYTGPSGLLLSLTGHHWTSVGLYGVAALLNIILNLILIWEFGPLGAALATATAMVLWNAAAMGLVRRRLGIRCGAL